MALRTRRSFGTLNFRSVNDRGSRLGHASLRLQSKVITSELKERKPKRIEDFLERSIDLAHAIYQLRRQSGTQQAYEWMGDIFQAYLRLAQFKDDFDAEAAQRHLQSTNETDNLKRSQSSDHMDTLNIQMIQFVFSLFFQDRGRKIDAMLNDADFMRAYDLILRTFRKRPGVIIDSEPTLKLIQLSSVIFSKNNVARNK